ncbi:hypothetical protein [Bradyrhizobium prioriisuperbiae]|uniref:hypothetical protein n=1 Tax=Bradyrhizobium prioriisuperbiae TaxID=2854389 RepID=UPI0028E440E0|nr:hypothetical protein [Bradyrhizobium prioritasuperba]
MAKLIPFDASIAMRLKAVDAARRARALPVGPERNELRQLALAYKALADNEAWLAGARAGARRRRMTRRLPSDDEA